MLVRLSQRNHALTIVLHHIVCDGWSLELRLRAEERSSLRHMTSRRCETLADAELKDLIDGLDADAYSARRGAIRRLEGLLFCDEHLPRVRSALDSRLQETADAGTTREVRRLLDLARPVRLEFVLSTTDPARTPRLEEYCLEFDRPIR